MGASEAAVEEPYGAIAHGYDRLASSYDAEIGRNSVGGRMHRIFQQELLRVFRPGDRVFEIGAGTGIDTLVAAAAGLEVVATDIAPQMLETLEEKARRAGLQGRIRTVELAAHRIGELRALAQEPFDGGYSHAGAFNMEPRVAEVPGQVARLVRPGGHFILTSMNRTSLFEALFYGMLRPRKGFRRLGGPIPMPISRQAEFQSTVVPVWSFTPGEVRRLFASEFELERQVGLQILLPPWNLAHYADRLSETYRAIEMIEERLKDRRPFHGWGNHVLQVFRRRAPADSPSG